MTEATGIFSADLEFWDLLTSTTYSTSKCFLVVTFVYYVLQMFQPEAPLFYQLHL